MNKNAYPEVLQINSNLWEKYKENFQLADKCRLLGDLIQKNLDERNYKVGEIDNVKFVLLTSYYKIIESFLSLLHLCNAGLTEDAKTIARKMFELAVSLEYIRQNPSEKTDKANKFRYHTAVKMYFLGKNKSEYKRLFHTYGKWDTIEKAYEIAKQYFPHNKNGDVKQEYRRGWWWGSKSLMDIADECNFDPFYFYHIIYTEFSESTHASSGSLTRYFDFTTNTFVSGSDEELIALLLYVGLKMFLTVTEIINEEFDMKLTDSINNLFAEIDALANAGLNPSQFNNQ